MAKKGKAILISGAEQNVSGEFVEGKGPFAESVFAMGIYQCCEALLISFGEMKLISYSYQKGISQFSLCLLSGSSVAKCLLSEHVENS